MKAMTKKQLVEALAAFDDDALVLIEDSESGYNPAGMVVTKTVVYHKKENHWQSPYDAVDELNSACSAFRVLDQLEPFEAITILFCDTHTPDK